MTEQTGTRPNGFFQKIIAKANAGLPAGPAQDSRLDPAGIFTEPSWQRATNRDGFMPHMPDAMDTGFEVSKAEDPLQSGEANGNMLRAWRGEEGPLSGADPGLNNKVDRFGDSTFSRSEPEAVGSASKSSYDTNVRGIEHTEVDHASGHESSFSTVRIESGVSNPPESNQVLSTGSKVERYADAKDRRQQAVSFDGHEGQGPKSQGDNRAGLSPTLSFLNDRTDDIPVPAKDTIATTTEREFSEKPPDDTLTKMPIDVDRGLRIPEQNAVGGDPPLSIRDEEDHNDAQAHGTGNPGPPGTSTRIGTPLNGPRLRPTRQAGTPKKSEQGLTAGKITTEYKEPDRPSNLPGAFVSDRVKAGPAPAPNNLTAPTGATNSAPGGENTGAGRHEREPHHPAPVGVQPDKPVAEVYLSPPADQRQSRFPGHEQKRPAQQTGEPQVQIGQIDVIVETPQIPVNTRQDSSRSTSGMASRYYLKGL